jgi:hypothetical protein
MIIRSAYLLSDQKLCKKFSADKDTYNRRFILHGYTAGPLEKLFEHRTLRARPIFGTLIFLGLSP